MIPNREIFKRMDSSSKPKNPEELSRVRILTMASEHPEDFPTGFDIEELQNEDFELEGRYQNRDPRLNNELDVRLQDSSLNASQRIWATVLLKRVMADLTRY